MTPLALAMTFSLSAVQLEGEVVIVERDGQSARVSAGCVARSAVELEAERSLFIACADGRVRVFRMGDAQFEFAHEVWPEGELVGLFVANGRVWVEVVRREARPLAASSSQPVELPAKVADTPAPPVAPRELERATETSPLFPEREGGTASISIGGTLSIPLGFSGVGLLTDLTAEWHAPVPFALRARLVRTGGLVGQPGGPSSQFTQYAAEGVWAFDVQAHFDGRFFAVGLGLGSARASTLTASGQPIASAALTLVQVLRVGALEGLHLEGTTTLVSFPTGFSFFGGEGHFAVPVREGWLLTLGGGGNGGTAWGEVAMRIRLPTDRWLALTPRAGITSIRGFTGPSVGVALELRW